MIKAGQLLPKVVLFRMGASGPESFDTEEWCRGSRIVLFSLPGAFTPTCSTHHLPGYIERADEIRACGVDIIACLSVNDSYVMDAWGKDQEVGDQVQMLADGNGTFTRATGLDIDLSKTGLGVRSARYSMVIQDQFVTHLNLDSPGQFEVSDATTILNLL